ncbi:bifunctional hydroxymethylpyrimidine kinase/phosphomethylpyrimidine kinase [Liquorilactobacillus capillatus]|uniref:pyridoxal kinase n=1 Tax=Liquorilactobacillus capillatus DSM 19910 TaxID=1423731 RepID=A0A0R1LZ83_9LACO|nr:bifunctional hydroxymethylpyrimidine kinase/phosphomethylpyrimidine kinase [Liquorilactobacillus capillatus]KRL00878.1 pyridoxal kinase [Liquorilactobacillus capillatus DSM 19910]
MEEVKRQGHLLVAEDISALGSLSLTAALPLLAQLGIPTALLPTSILSTQSEGFDQPVSLSTAKWLPRVWKHWQEQQVVLDSVLIGYIGELAVGTELNSLLAKIEPTHVVIDPVFADNGQLYPTFIEQHLQQLYQLLKWANIITPNYTEACFLAAGQVGSPLKQQFVFTEAELLQKLGKIILPGGKVVITGVVEQATNQIGCIWLDESGQVIRKMFPRLAGHFYGSGDVFAALLAGFTWQGLAFSAAINEAAELTYLALRETAETNSERRLGIRLSRVMAKLAQKMNK